MPGLAIRRDHRSVAKLAMENESTEQVIERLSRHADRVIAARPKLSLRTVMHLIRRAWNGDPVQRIEL
jgi:hypothetical protein